MKNKIINNAIIYFTFHVINKIIPFGLIPLLTYYTSPKEYALITIFSLYVTFLTPILGLCLNSVIYQIYYNYSINNRVFIVRNGILIVLISTFSLLILFIPLSQFFEKFLVLEIELVKLAFITACASMCVSLTSSFLQISRESFTYGLLQIISIVPNVGITLVGILYFEIGWEARVYAIAFSALATTVIICIYLLNRKDCNFMNKATYATIPNMIKLGTQLLPSTVIGILLVNLDKIFISTWLTMDELGAYSVALSLALLVEVILTPLALALFPTIYQNESKIRKTSLERKTVAIAQIYWISCVMIFILVLIISPILFHFFINKIYIKSLEILPFIVISLTISSAGTVFQAVILANQKNDFITKISIISLASSCALNTLLITKMNFLGVGWALVITAVITALLNYYYSRKIYRHSWANMRYLVFWLRKSIKKKAPS